MLLSLENKISRKPSEVRDNELDCRRRRRNPEIREKDSNPERSNNHVKGQRIQCGSVDEETAAIGYIVSVVGDETAAKGRPRKRDDGLPE